MGIFDKLFGGGKGGGEPPHSGRAPDAPQSGVDLEEASRETSRRLDAFWSSVGQLESDVIANMISPQFMGGQAWPTPRQAYRVVRRPTGVLLATDGLSEPISGPEGNYNGTGIELFIETPDIPEALQGRANVADLGGTWAYEILYQAAALIAGNGGFASTLDRLGVISTEFPGVSESNHVKSQIPSEFVTERDSIGALLGGPRPDFPSHVEGPFEAIRIVPVVLLRASELEEVVAGGAEARRIVSERLGTHVVRFDRT